MENKEIIIDGVDVKDCKRRIGKDNFCRYYKRSCAENNYNCIWKKYLRKKEECEKLKAKIEYVFSDASPNFDYFCDICVAKDKCNQYCCFEQIKELIYEAK